MRVNKGHLLVFLKKKILKKKINISYRLYITPTTPTNAKTTNIDTTPPATAPSFVSESSVCFSIPTSKNERIFLSDKPRVKLFLRKKNPKQTPHNNEVHDTLGHYIDLTSS